MTYILTCGCESQYGGFPSEWDGETRECEPAVFYGCLCDKHFGEYDARPTQYQELSDEVIDALQDALNGWKYIRECHGDLYGVGWDRVQDKLEAILNKASEK